ncbi:MAG TPA: hypothetical protein VEI52_27085 [Terriglobales bacterium]|nr:hypothetical protein [Terriglobales bacterium]
MTLALLREMWTQAKADGYTELDPFSALVLPEPDLLNERSLTLDEMKNVIDRAQEPFRTYFWIWQKLGYAAARPAACQCTICCSTSCHHHAKGLARQD